MAVGDFHFDSVDEAATTRLAGWLAAALDVPALIFLNGDLGAGKTAFARGFIRACCGASTQVPSPTFALVQPYAAAQFGAPAILHADLYRLADPQEIDELGLIDALGTQICLIEWAANGDGVLPAADIEVTLDNMDSQDDGKDDARRITIRAAAPIIEKLQAAKARDEDLQGFLHQAGWGAARRAALAGDASTRRYERVQLNEQKAVLMDWQAAPDGPAIYDGQPYSKVAHLAEAMPRFADMVGWLREAGLAAPMLYALDRPAGFALLEDFGDHTIANDTTLDRQTFYFEAVETLLHLHTQTPASFLPAYDGAVQAVETSLFLDWYLPWRGVAVSDSAKAAWQTLWQTLGDKLLAETPVAVLRDFHSVNLIWRPHAQGRFRIGLIDVQDALKGHAAYDLASLIYDARVDVAPAHQARALAYYLTRRFGDDETARAAFTAALAICTAQRNLKIAGIFIRLAERDGKPAYLAHLPRIRGYIRTALATPILQPVNDWLAAHAPHALDDVTDTQ